MRICWPFPPQCLLNYKMFFLLMWNLDEIQSTCFVYFLCFCINQLFLLHRCRILNPHIWLMKSLHKYVFLCHACIFSHYISYLKSVMCHIFSYQQSNSLRSSFTSWWSFFYDVCLYVWLRWCSRWNACVDFAGPLWMQCLCHCIHAVQAKC